MRLKNRGFTLLEVLIVLAIIGLIATIILPAIRRSAKSVLMDGIRSVTSQVNLTYDNALFTGRVHRMVFDTQKGTFWTEIAPKGFTGRAPILTENAETEKRFKESLLRRLDQEAKQATDTETPILEIPVKMRDEIRDVPWDKLTNDLIEPQTFTGNLVFVKITTGLSKIPVLYPVNMTKPPEETDPKFLSYVYFFPSGTATPVSFQIGFRSNTGGIDTNAQKFTLNLNTLTGKTNLIEGFQEANFELPQ